MHTNVPYNDDAVNMAVMTVMTVVTVMAVMTMMMMRVVRIIYRNRDGDDLTKDKWGGADILTPDGQSRDIQLSLHFQGVSVDP